ncbi:hypothetical protein AV530_010904 [Patagioenas fasciata monilis]|uniref:Uncharacterized protein n=1 Tax=Patagioenas fasciata monilis TaxID=372326 RepID=A0A1V4K868_PATFA|nr:hypothetical protein AV530_010904 [Patagioenas fasciata monilis]
MKLAKTTQLLEDLLLGKPSFFIHHGSTIGASEVWNLRRKKVLQQSYVNGEENLSTITLKSAVDHDRVK